MPVLLYAPGSSLLALSLCTLIVVWALLTRWTPEAQKVWPFLRERFSPREPYGLWLTLALVLVGASFWAFTEIIDWWTDQPDLFAFDAWANETAGLFASPTFTPIAIFITDLGGFWVSVPLIIATLIVLWIRDEKWDALLVLLAFVPGEGLVYLLKAFFSRVRPELQIIEAHGYSFPSGHAFTGFILYIGGIYLLWRHTTRASYRWPGTVLLLLLAFGVGLSRIYLGVHYFTDVIGGWTLALMWLLACYVLVRMLKTRHGIAETVTK